MKVIGTAGHIDHGKSTLVRALTGIDPDRLEEEKQRGMTIDLGFAWLTLPSGEAVSVVDVPGHERFVKNMLAGAGGIDVALLVVAADEVVMPQTREHLAILDLLGVTQGVVALTKADLVDAEWLELARYEIQEVLLGTGLEGAPVVPVSATTGSGQRELLTALDEAVRQVPVRQDRGLPFVPVDRVFTVAGFGTVVTGTLHQGTLRVGQEVEVLPEGRRVRVRTMQTHRRQVESAEPGARVALSLTGIDRREVRRGDVLALPGTVPVTRRLDAEVRVLEDAPFGLVHGSQIMLHLGAAERSATLSVLNGAEIPAGGQGWVQLRLSEPVAAVRGQHFILRAPAPARTLAGGVVVDLRPRHRRMDAGALQRLDRLASSDLSTAVAAALPLDRPRTPAEIATVVTAPVAAVAKILGSQAAEGGAVRLGEAYLAPRGWIRASTKVREVLAGYHAARPDRPGMPREELRRRLGWPHAVWNEAVHRWGAAGLVRDDGAVLADPGHAGGSAVRAEQAERLLCALAATPFSPPAAPALLTAAGTDLDLLMTLKREGRVVQVGEGLFLGREAYDQMAAFVIEAIQTHGEITVAQVRDRFGTSRKYALALLEHLDAERITRRVGDARVLGPRARR